MSPLTCCHPLLMACDCPPSFSLHHQASRLSYLRMISWLPSTEPASQTECPMSHKPPPATVFPPAGRAPGPYPGLSPGLSGSPSAGRRSRILAEVLNLAGHVCHKFYSPSHSSRGMPACRSNRRNRPTPMSPSWELGITTVTSALRI